MCRANADCHVEVVAAGVHVAVGGGEIQAGRFGDGEGVHVGAKQNCGPGQSAFDVQHDA